MVRRVQSERGADEDGGISGGREKVRFDREHGGYVKKTLPMGG